MLLFFLAFISIITIDKTTGGYKTNQHIAKDDLFIIYDANNINNYSGMSFVLNNYISTDSSSYFPNTEVWGTKEINTDRKSIISYQVQEGDNLQSIADKFNITSETIEWANSIKNSKVSEGDELLILPVTGVLYYVEKNDSPGLIAQKHKADIDKIMAFNNITNEKAIMPGDSLIIPDGKKPKPVIPQRSPVIASSGGFVAVTYGTITQGSHAGHLNAVDIANACGTPIYATSSGTVTSTGNDYVLAGRYIWINHNGMNALYGHLQSIHVSAGQTVSAGQQIGTMGNTGYTIGATGCHLHFETRGRQNPFSYMQRGHVMQ